MKYIQSTRWVSPPEAAYRIFKFDLFDMYPPVFTLQVHLPNLHGVSFNSCATTTDILNNENTGKIMLTAYFQANAEGTSTLDYLYSELPEFHVWDGKQKIWRIRDQRGSVGRMAFVSPSEGEHYYLRLLLCNVKGATSFDSLKTVNGHVALTFKEACEKRGLLEQDNYADVCMQEAAIVQMPIALRRLFAILLICVDGINARNLWNKYYSDLSEDFAHAVSGQSNEVTMHTYVEVQKYIKSMGRSMKEFCIPKP